MSNLITLKLEGLPNQDGHMLLKDFLNRANGLFEALICVDKLEGNLTDETLNYRIIDARHNSPLSLTLELVVRESVERVEPHHIERRRQRFFQTAKAIESRQTMPDDTPNELVAAFQSISYGAGDQFLRGEIVNGEAHVVLDASFSDSVVQLRSTYSVEMPAPTAGSYLGEIQGTVHSFFKESKKPHLVIRELSTRELVKCYFDPMMYEKAVETLVERDSVVFVEGSVTQDPKTGVTSEINVSDFRPAPLFDLNFFKSFIGARPNLTGTLDSEEAIYRNRQNA